MYKFLICFLLFNFAVRAEWSEPVVISDPANDGITPKIATDPNGNAVAVWSENGVITASTKLVNEEDWSTGVAISEGANAQDPQIGIDAAGTATVIWRQGDTDSINTSRALLGQDWSPPFLLNSGGITPQIAVNASGNAVAVWNQRANSSVNGNYSIGGVWGVEEVISDVVDSGYSFPVVGIAADGVAVAAWLRIDTSTLIYYIETAIRTSSWNTGTSFPSSSGVSFTPPEIAVNANSDAIFAWSVSDGENTVILSANYFNGRWSAISAIAPRFLGSTDISVALNDNGEGIIAWSQSQEQIVMTRFVRSNGTLLNFNEISDAFQPFVSINNNSEIVIGYLTWDDSLVTARTALWGQAFGAPTTVSTEVANLSDAAITPDGNAFLIWEINDGNFLVQVSQGTNLFAAPLPPSSISGRQLTNRFLTQADIINEISWTASPSLDVTSYNVYRGNKRVANVPSTSPLIYEDHNRSANVSTTYSITAVNDSGESEPISITLP